jgi:hypothetical protein
MRSSPTRSTEGRGSHHGLRGRRRGRAWVGNREADKRKDNEVRGGAYGAPLALVPLPVVAAPLPQHPVGQGRGAARRCSGEWMGRKLLRWGKWSRVASEIHFIVVRIGEGDR